MSKHEDIIKHILSLEVGSKISVRGVASELGVSEGTAYRAIKDCDTLGFVSTIPRVGTVRIEKVEKKSIETLTFSEVVNIVDGTILGGKDGIYKNLNKFVIGAMTLGAIENYISPGCLVIVGNRHEVQTLALNNNCAVLITGGFQCGEDVKALANEKALPIISSTYDTFTVASMINKAISESLIKKDIVLVEDIMKDNPYYLKVHDNVRKWKGLINSTKHERYPVVDDEMRVVGMVALKDLSKDTNDDELIGRVMSKEPITLTPKTTVAYAAHVMVWQGIELCPVVEGKRLIGVVSGQDVIKALQYASRQPQVGETIEDMILKKFDFYNVNGDMSLSGKITAEMLDSIGTASWGSLNMLLSTVGIMALRQRSNMNVSTDSIMTYFIKPVQIDSDITIRTNIIDMGRNFCKVEIDMYDHKEELIAKSIISAKILRM